MTECEKAAHTTGRTSLLLRAKEVSGNSVSWPVFLALLKRFYAEQGWELEYEPVEEESCAICSGTGEVRDRRLAMALYKVFRLKQQPS